MTTRNRRRAAAGAALLGGLALGSAGCAGCATPGPLHVYTLASAVAAEIRDAGEAAVVTVPSLLERGEDVVGFAYDPYTDHFFLRLAPGDRVRVVDRPARAIKREFELPGMPSGAGDVAVKPRNGHIFLLVPGRPAVRICNRFGKPVRTVTLAGLDGPPAGLAYDPSGDHLLVLLRKPRPRVLRFSLAGEPQGGFELDRDATGSIGYDPDRRELFAPLPSAGGAVGVFDETGRLRRTLSMAGTFVDVGMRSFVRLF